MEYFLAHLDMKMWEQLADLINQNLARDTNNAKLVRRGGKRLVTAIEALSFYGVLLKIENTYGNNTPLLRKHFQSVKEELGPNFTMGIDRFEAIRSAFWGPDEFMIALCENFHTATCKFLSDVFVVTGDEGVGEYQPNRNTKQAAEAMGIPVPVVFIPRKPHPNGLLFYFLCTYVENPVGGGEKLPYIMQMKPHLVQGDCTPVEVIKEFLAKYSIAGPKPVVVLDAGFSSPDLIDYIRTWGGQVVMSSGENTYPYLWKALSNSLVTQQWHAAVHTSGLVASCHAITTNKGDKAYQYVLSTATSPSTPPVQATPPPVSNNNNDIRLLDVPVVRAIVSHIPLFAADTLQKMTIVQLREICKKYNIKTGKKKEDYVRLIIARSTSLNTHLESILTAMKTIKEVALPDPAPLHDFYKAHFNFIDISDRRWYAVQEHHGNHNWRSKMLQFMLRYVVLNAWTHAIKIEYMHWKDWHGELGTALALYKQ